MHRLIIAALSLSLTACAASSPAPDGPDQTETSPVTVEPTEPVVAVVVPRIAIEFTGGRCLNGACFSRTELTSDGVISFHSNTVHAEGSPDQPLTREVTDAELERIERVLNALDPAALEDGYGNCCNAHVDGSDTFVSFFGADGGELRKVRISKRVEAPPVLLELVASMRDLQP